MADRDEEIREPDEGEEMNGAADSAQRERSGAPIGGDPADRAGDDSEATDDEGGEPKRFFPTIVVRYGRMKHVGEFSYPPHVTLAPGRKLVVSTDRGIEVGQPLDFTCQSCPPCVSREQMRAYSRNSGGDVYRLKNGRVLREATEADLHELEHIERDTVEKIETCARFAIELGLKMRIVGCEHLFGGERIVFYFMADERVDFRELVHKLAGEYQTRIEMRQVGARDEARLLADYETCGRQCCCRNYLKTLKPISMQMAKMQKATLDPAKVSGRCGRLKCCLRYEHETYEALVRRMPRVGSRIACPEGVGKVVDRQIMTQLVRVLDDAGRLFAVPVDEITERDLPPPPPSATSDEDLPIRRSFRTYGTRPRKTEPERINRMSASMPDYSSEESLPAEDEPADSPAADADADADANAGIGFSEPAVGSAGPKPEEPGIAGSSPAGSAGAEAGMRPRRRRGRRRGRGRRPGGPSASGRSGGPT